MRCQIFVFLFLAFLYGCKQDNTSGEKQPAASEEAGYWSPPAAGTVVAEHKERVTEDNLNEKYFSVTVFATEQSKEGTYRLKLEYGFNRNETDLQLPEWTQGAVLKPILKKQGKYHCLLGFDAGDGQFRELYDINAADGDIRMKQIKGYYKSTP